MLPAFSTWTRLMPLGSLVGNESAIVGVPRACSLQGGGCVHWVCQMQDSVQNNGRV